MNIDRFKNEHAAILEKVGELRKLIQTGIATNADAIAQLLVGMSTTIKLHLAAEDQMLYPTMLKSSQVQAAQVAKRFQTEMGAIAKAYIDFVHQWNTGTKIAAAPENFREAANGVFKALFERVQRENQELYPLAAQV